MKTGVKVLLGFIVGAGAGAVTSGIVMKKHYEKELYEEIIPDIKESYEDRMNDLEDKLDDLALQNIKLMKENSAYIQIIMDEYGLGAAEKIEGEAKKREKEEEEGKKSSKSAKKEEKSEKVKVEKGKKAGNKTKLDTNKVDYTKNYKPIDVDDDERVKFDMKPKPNHGLKTDDEGHVYSAMASKGKPFIISIDEYTDMNGYDKQTYTYWAYDEVFTDETEDPDLNIVMYLGHDLVELWEEYSPDHESLYIRNPQQKTDYEIIVREQSYADYMREPDFDE